MRHRFWRVVGIGWFTVRFFFMGSGTIGASYRAACKFVDVIGEGVAHGYSNRKLPS